MSYRPLNKQQAEEMARPPLIADGKYQCELLEFTHTDKTQKPLTDRNGEDMTRIKLKIWDQEGKERTIFTNLFWGENNKMSYRTRHFAESFKIVDLYDSGGLYERFGECLGAFGCCDIYTQKERAKNDGTNEVWPAKNDVRDFIESNKSAPVVTSNDFDDSVIPF